MIAETFAVMIKIYMHSTAEIYCRRMSVEQEVTIIKKALEKLVKDPEDIPENGPALIEELDKVDMTLKVLQKTKIGFTLNSIRKTSSDEGVQKAAKTLLKKWQTLENSPPKKAKSKNDANNEDSGKKDNFQMATSGEAKKSSLDPTRNKKNQLIFSDQPDFR